MTLVKPITGFGITDRVNMALADLGIPRWDSDRNALALMFGDNFSTGWNVDWQSPSIVMYDTDYNVVGIPTKTGIVADGARRQLWDYEHENREYSTILPCDFIRVGDMWYVAAMVTQGLGNEKRTVFWQSPDLVDWEKTSPYVSLPHRDGEGHFVGHPGNVNLTFDQLGDYVYIFGTGGLARDRGIWLWRNRASNFPYGYWEPWGRGPSGGWAWGNPNEGTPIWGGKAGEICFRMIQNNCVLSFFDAGAYRQTALTTPYPTDDWTAANRVDYAFGSSFPQLYGGYICPTSHLNQREGMRFLVSQWHTATNDPYHVVLFTDTLAAKGPLVEPPPQPEPEPEDTDVSQPQDTYELLLKELSASGSTPIVSPEGNKLSLRQAIAEMYVKIRGILTLGGRPRDPRQGDDLYGHVLNLRAEHLQTQALVYELCRRQGVDVKSILDNVQRSLG